MKRPVRHEDGMYHINGNKYKMLMGSRIQVHNRNAYKTEGGLTRDKLMMNKWGRIVSLAKHRTAKKEKRLEKAGYFAKKGKFGYVKKTARKSGKATRGSRKMKGRKMRGGATDAEVAEWKVANPNSVLGDDEIRTKLDAAAEAAAKAEAASGEASASMVAQAPASAPTPAQAP